MAKKSKDDGAVAPEAAQISGEGSSSVGESASDLPLPASLQVNEPPAESKIKVEAIAPSKEAMPVVSVPIAQGPTMVGKMAKPAVGITPPAQEDAVRKLVTIRALKTASTAPRIGDFDFINAIGKDARSSKPIRGVFKKDFLYKVPVFVAQNLVGKNWALQLDG